MSAPAAAPHTDLHAALFTIGLAWSGHPNTVRTDPQRRQVYTTTERAPLTARLQQPPNYPWAIHTTTAGRNRTILVADFDRARTDSDTTPAPTAAAEADLFSAMLSALGCPHLLVRSSVHDGVDSGRRHVLVLLDQAWEPPIAAAVSDWLTRQFLTVDRSPMAASRTAAIRFPGAPHRGGGHAELAAIAAPDNADPHHVLTGQLRAPTDLATRLLACDPAGGAPVPADLIAGTAGRRIADPTEIDHLCQAAAHQIADRVGVLAPANPGHHRHLPPPPPLPPLAAIDPQLLAPDTAVRIVGGGAWASLIDPHNLLPHLDELHRQAVESHATVTPMWRTQGHRICPSPTVSRPNSGAGRDPRLRALNPELARFLNAPGELPAHLDASAIQHRGLMSLVVRRLSFDDVWDLARPGRQLFTHSYSERDGRHSSTRIPRTRTQFREHLRRQYLRACTAVEESGFAQPADTEASTAALNHVRRLLAAAERDTRMGYTKDGHTLMRVYTAHLKRAAATASRSYYAGCRDLAADAGIRSPQTVATANAQLVAAGYLIVEQPSEGRRATGWALGSGPDWTQGEPAPQTLPREDLWLLLATRSLHFQHDVWLASNAPTAASLVLLHLAHYGRRTVPELQAATGHSARAIVAATAWLNRVGLVDDQGEPAADQAAYIAAAERTHTAGAWSRLHHRWLCERARWDWWCAEKDFLSARNDTREQAWTSSVLADRGRYPRHPDNTPDHGAAMTACAHTITLTEVTR
ncbi:hypothetical protein ACFQNE_02695 [Gordonia phosphorivorans]|uniref:Uncharacterized protein n=1 Tax=Gordonia phosphorivorans TaxID=1056982 RepID=A0ABV6H4B7_9ACTN